MRTVVWFRPGDLRLSDHPALRAAIAAGEVVPLLVLDPRVFAAAGARAQPHRVQVLLDAAGALAEGIAARGSRLIVAAGRGDELVPRLASAWGADRVVAQRSTDPALRGQDDRLTEALGARYALHEGATLLRAGTLRTGAGRPYAVFGAFAAALHRTLLAGRPLAAPRALPPLPADVRSSPEGVPALEDLGLRRRPGVLEGGERAARRRLARFVRGGAAAYAERRDRLDLQGTSRLSADLACGALSVREVWAAVEGAPGGGAGPRAFLNELVWREFAHHTLWDRPELLARPFRPAFEGFPWRRDERSWRAWAEGRTGYPVVDAAARQLLLEGFVHNRARMISASFLAKQLLLDFRRGEAHYLRHLADADVASNDLGWQWSAGCGCDAQPWFRVFNPIAQGERFDPEGAYVRRWVPELSRLPARWIHRPWQAPPDVLAAARVRLGADYPRPVVDHAAARARFLALAAGHLRRSGPRARRRA